jgi:predicted ATPase
MSLAPVRQFPGNNDATRRLPVYRTPLVGRDDDLDALLAAVDSGAGLVTLCGAPGVGKTRLAVALLERVRQTPERGVDVGFCSLQESRSLHDVVSRVAETLDLDLPETDRPDQAVRFVGSHLQEHQLLLVLDNAEHLTDLLVELLDDWLFDRSETTLLVTSRTPLEHPAEHRVDLPPLESAEAVELYRQCVDVQRVPDALTDFPDADVARLADQLDGLPLALELAASRLPILGPSELIERIDQQFDLLQRRSAERTEWHASLREAIAWSWSLLEGWERSALTQLGAFRGDFTVESAEAVVRLDDFREAPPLPQVLQDLLDNSLLQTVRPGDDGEEATVRFTLFASVREFVVGEDEQPDEGRWVEELEEARRRHAEWWAERGEDWRDSFIGRDSEAALDAMGHNFAEFDAAFKWALADDPVLAGEVAAPASYYLNAREPFRPLESMPRRVLEALEEADGIPQQERDRTAAQMHLFLGKYYHRRGALSDGRRQYESVRQRAGSDRLTIPRIDATLELGHLEMLAGDFESSESLLEEGNRQLEEHAPEAGRLYTCCAHYRAIHAEMNGELERAETLYHRALKHARDHELEGYEAYDLHNLAHLEAGRGRFETSIRHARQAAEIYRRHNNRAALAPPLEKLALGLLGVGRLEDARQQLTRAITVERRVGSGGYLGQCIFELAVIELTDGEREAAAEHLDRARSLVVESEEENFIGPIRCLTERLNTGPDGLDPSESQVEVEAASEESGLDQQSRHILRAVEGLVWADAARQFADRQDWESCTDALDRARSYAGLHDVDIWDGFGTARPIATAAGRIVERVAAAHSEPIEAVRQREDALKVAASDASWFEWQGERVDVSRRAAPCRIFQKLVEMRRSHPGTSLSKEEIFEAGWPGETVHPDSVRSRVYTAIRTLRDFGLRDLLLTRDGGYLLDPDVPVVEQ